MNSAKCLWHFQCALSLYTTTTWREKNEFQQKLNEHFVCFIKNAALFSFFQFIPVFSRSETSWVIFVVYFTWLFFFQHATLLFFLAVIFVHTYCMFARQNCISFWMNAVVLRLKFTFQAATQQKRTEISFLATVNARFDMQYFNFLRFGYRLTVSNHVSFEKKTLLVFFSWC